MKLFLIAFVSILIGYLILDGLWLGVIAKQSYTSAMAGMLRESYPIWPWATFYTSYCAAIAYLAVLSNVDMPWWRAAISGALLGMAAYGAYNLTNYAILEGWPLSITLKDWAWGTSITCVTSIFGWWVVQVLGNKT